MRKSFHRVLEFYGTKKNISQGKFVILVGPSERRVQQDEGSFSIGSRCWWRLVFGVGGN